MMRVLVFAATMASGAAAYAAPRDAVRRDVEGYAMASCFNALDDPALKDQADAWGSVIVQRGRGALPAYQALRSAVLRAMTIRRMPRLQDQTRPMADKPLPLMYCVEIIDIPVVRSAIEMAVVKLAPAYRRK